MAAEIYNRVDIPQLECHFKWFNELNNTFNGKWLTELLKKHLHKDLKNILNSDARDDRVDLVDDHVEVIEDQDEIHDETNGTGTVEQSFTMTSSRLAELSWCYTLIVRNVFEKNFAEAFEKSKELLLKEEALNPAQPKVHIDTFAYIGLANQLNILKQWRSFTEMSSANDDEAAVIMEKIETLRSSADSNEGKAFIYAMKSNLARDMMDSKLRIDFAKMATEMNPQWAGWQQTLYFAMRQQRRMADFHQRPSQLEIDACERSYELEANERQGNISISNAVAMARMNQELLRFCHRGSLEHHEITERAIKFAREAVQLKPHSMTMKIRLASLLSSNNINRQNQREGYDEALRIYRECETGRCSSEICHKLGKFYDNRKNPNFNSATALKWFEKGLEAHIGNFPCFADMLKNSVFQRNPTAKIIDKIDTILSFQSKRDYRCQLMFIKGLFLWTNDPEASLQWWLMAMEEAADTQVNFVRLATFNFCFIKDGNNSQALRTMYHVKFFMQRQEVTNAGDENFMKLKDIVESIIGQLSRWNCS